MKALFILMSLFCLTGCGEKSIYGRYYSLASIGSLSYYLNINPDGSFKQSYGSSVDSRTTNTGQWRYIQKSSYELLNWREYTENSNKLLIIYADIEDGEIIIVEGFDKYNFRKR